MAVGQWEFGSAFRRIDGNGDGKISPGELRECMRTVGEELSLEEAEEVVRWADTDGDGQLGEEEFMELVGEGGEESMREAFKVYEMKGEGCITAESLRGALQRLGESRSVGECEAMIRTFDGNGDGVISFEEFKTMLL